MSDSDDDVPLNQRKPVTAAAPAKREKFFNDTATTEIYTIAYTLSLHDALP
eukprot:COSAG02_NODE_54476_length_296_cov_0.461929_1_plen_50_part_10